MMFRSAVARSAMVQSAVVRGSARLLGHTRRARHDGAVTSRVRAAVAAADSTVSPAGRRLRSRIAAMSPARCFSSTATPAGSVGAGGADPAALAGGAAAASGAGTASPAQLPLILDADASNIEQIMVQSYGVPTILDCHADWCAPCKQLAPILEDLVSKSGGRLRLAKLDVDANKELAAQLRVQSLPTVYGIAGGKVVDQFVGLPQQEQFQTFVDKLLKHGADAAAATPGGGAGGGDAAPRTPAEIFDAGSLALRQGAFDAARNAFETVIALEESEAEGIAAKIEQNGGRQLSPKTDEQVKLEEMAAAAHASMAQMLLMSGETDEAQTYLAEFRKQPKWSKYVHTPQVSQPMAIVELYANTEGVEQDLTKVEERLAADPDDLGARYSLASHMMLQGKPEEALKEAFYVVRKEKDWEGGRARDFCVNVFNALGDTNPIVTAGRRRLSNLVF